MVYAMAWWAWHGIWYCLASLAWYMVCPVGQGIVYSFAWYGYMVWGDMYMAWPGGHGMVYGMV